MGTWEEELAYPVKTYQHGSIKTVIHFGPNARIERFLCYRGHELKLDGPSDWFPKEEPVREPTATNGPHKRMGASREPLKRGKEVEQDG